MKILYRLNYIRQVSNNIFNNIKRHNYVLTKLSTTTYHKIYIKYPYKLAYVVCVYSSDNKKQFISFEKKAEALKDALEHKKEQLKDTELKIRLKGEEIVRDIKHQKEVTGQNLRVKKEYLFKDIRETKAKVKEKFEEVVERENPFTVPNILCITRIAMTPYLGYVILHDNYNLALGLMIFAGITDMLDGWIARTWESQSSKIGSFLDPMADKILIATLFISLTWQQLIPLPLTLLIIGRDAALVAAGFVIRYMSLPPPRTLSRYFDVTYATAQLAPTFISKVNTVIQLILVGSTLAAPVFDYVDHAALKVLCGITAATTIASAFSYLVRKDTYKFLKRKS